MSLLREASAHLLTQSASLSAVESAFSLAHAVTHREAFASTMELHSSLSLCRLCSSSTAHTTRFLRSQCALRLWGLRYCSNPREVNDSSSSGVPTPIEMQ
eukprot:CAMPEP_0183321826 /NCGR_PEP_ID=MMETSP0160_2-20130417/69944_1 /TAXON_ID=2839 ORGANISM="Odontella Sinensis, Strain Grunow 1884" /NCGR_SAMPLE_ID=MMETSP0160_2 /ASSEMBLY_ACC=CAM_ASM_000250 /LENGTH=99 /DNA_ID=CAMNT_0025488849 /DNA_START=547 /DNA_END=846 /DNA_ORIENTATION=-